MLLPTEPALSKERGLGGVNLSCFLIPRGEFWSYGCFVPSAFGFSNSFA